MTWSADDNAAAAREGWFLSACAMSAHEELQLQREDDPDDKPGPVFEDDYSAWRHVVSKALEGSELHQRALRHLKAVSRAEFDRIVDNTLDGKEPAWMA